jgi:hypothetical protein
MTDQFRVETGGSGGQGVRVCTVRDRVQKSGRQGGVEKGGSGRWVLPHVVLRVYLPSVPVVGGDANAWSGSAESSRTGTDCSGLVARDSTGHPEP